jgi:hypothetical protein
MMAFDATGIPLGTVWQKTWTRDAAAMSLLASEKGKLRAKTPIEQKESLRWIEGVRAARDVAAACPDTMCICVGDSESDIYEMFCERRTVPEQDDVAASEVHLLVRACQTRNTEGDNWLEDVRATKCLEYKSVSVSLRRAKIAANTDKRQQSRDARKASVEVRATTVTLQPPYRFDRELPPITVNVVLVEDVNPPAGCQPIQWLLVTTLPIDTLQRVQEIGVPHRSWPAASRRAAAAERDDPDDRHSGVP